MSNNEMAVDAAIIQALIDKRQALDTIHPNFKGLIYGESGFGKTVKTMEIAQAITPPGKTIEFIDFLEGWVSLLNHPGLTRRTNRQQYEGLSQLEFLAKAIKLGIEPFDVVGTVVIDEISAMGKSDLDIVLKTRAKNDKSKDPNVPTQPDFYANTERMRRTVTELLQADINVLFVAHIREDKLSNGRVVTRPAFMPAFSEIFRQMLHMVANLSAEEFTAEDGTQDYVRAFQVHPTRSISAKTRVGGLPVTVDSETLIPAIIEWMKGERDEEPTHKGDPNLAANTGVETTGENLVEHHDSDVESTDSEDVAIVVD